MFQSKVKFRFGNSARRDLGKFLTTLDPFGVTNGSALRNMWKQSKRIQNGQEKETINDKKRPSFINFSHTSDGLRDFPSTVTSAHLIKLENWNGH